MKNKITFLPLIFFFLSPILAQWPGNLPSSPNSISLLNIADWMLAAGEITQTERTGPLSIRTLNGKSHLIDKSIPYSLSDWYGYGIICGNSFTITHTLGVSGAPLTKRITYGTVLSNLSGDYKCWITQNLGADHSPGSYSDVTEASGGWYWQFNRLQGYQVADNGTTRTPSNPWNTLNDGNGNWSANNDPCAKLLGNGWRIPIQAEWDNVVNSPQNWSSGNPFTSVLKLHAAGFILYSSGVLSSRGSDLNFWSTTEYSSSQGWNMPFGGVGLTGIYADYKSYGFAVRCLKD